MSSTIGLSPNVMRATRQNHGRTFISELEVLEESEKKPEEPGQGQVNPPCELA